MVSTFMRGNLLDHMSHLGHEAFDLGKRPVGESDELFAQQHEATSEGFFQGERVAIEIGERLLSADDMQHIADVLASYSITIWAVRTSNPQTHRMVQEIGLAAEWLDKSTGESAAPTSKGAQTQWEVHLGREGSSTPLAKPVAEFQTLL